MGREFICLSIDKNIGQSQNPNNSSTRHVIRWNAAGKAGSSRVAAEKEKEAAVKLCMLAEMSTV